MMSWFKYERLDDGVQRITEPRVHEFYRANLYRISGRDFDIQFDFGVGVESLMHGWEPDFHPVLAIASHAHVDHIGSFHAYSRRAGHRLEAHTFASLDDEGTLESWFRGQEGAVRFGPRRGWTFDDYRLKPAPLTDLLEEGDKIDLGNRSFTVLHLPGHSPGSIALLDEHNGEFFSGDAIYDDTLVDDVPNADIEAYLKTMHRLLDLDIATGHGGHGPSFDRKRMREIARDYIAARESWHPGNKKGQTKA